MSKCSIIFESWNETVTVEGSTVSEALAMRAEYLLNVGEGGVSQPPDEVAVVESASPTTPKPSGFLTKVKGGE